MLDIEPPEVPAELLSPVVSEMKPAKESFFKKLFSARKKAEIQNNTPIQAPAPLFSEPLPELPPLDIPLQDDWTKNISGEPIEQYAELSVQKKTIGKSKGKKSKDKKTTIAPLDITKKFSWSEPITEQDGFIQDSNRNNESVNKLISASEQHIEDTQKVIKNIPEIAGEEMTHTGLSTPNVPDNISDVLPKSEQDSTHPLSVPDIPIIHPDEQKIFNDLDKQHDKLKNSFAKKVRDKNFSANKKELMQLLKDYDERIERKIERKQIELSNKHVKLNELRKSLQSKAHELSKLHSHLKLLEKGLNEKESKIDTIITTTVSRQIARRTDKERKKLNNSLKETMSFNKQLKRKLDVLENDRVQFDKNKDKLLEDERKKVVASQMMYEKKLSELNEERNTLVEDRKNFESKKIYSLELLKKADGISNELRELQRLRNVIDTDKTVITKELTRDREMKMAIDDAELKVAKEKHDLDNMIFSKYIDWKLNTSPNSLLNTSIFKDEMDNIDKSSKLHPMIEECRKLIFQKKMFDAKVMYNKIKAHFESSEMDKTERNMVYNSLRALYNEIKLAQLTYVED